MSLPTVDLISSKLDLLRNELRRVEREAIHPMESVGRVLGQDLIAFRDSPACDVSAMDGYALHWSSLHDGDYSVRAIARAGAEPGQLNPDHAIQIFTGGAVPAQSDCVVPREQCDESPGRMRLTIPIDKIKPGQHIRRQGENAKAGSIVLREGCLVGAPELATLASSAAAEPIQVFRKVTLSILNTGDELVPFDSPIQPWQIRDSNGPMLEAMMRSLPWIDWKRDRVPDQLESTQDAIAKALERSDAVLLTGGVSMGDTDFVPRAIENAGGKIVFHRIPIKPGKPLLGAVGPRGQLILGLPGNPVSVAVTFRRYGLELLQFMAGFSRAEPAMLVNVETEDTKSIDLTWFRLAQRTSEGNVKLIDSMGSGDVSSLGLSDGFIEVPAGAVSSGQRRFYAWR